MVQADSVQKGGGNVIHHSCHRTFTSHAGVPALHASPLESFVKQLCQLMLHELLLQQDSTRVMHCEAQLLASLQAHESSGNWLPSRYLVTSSNCTARKCDM